MRFGLLSAVLLVGSVVALPVPNEKVNAGKDNPVLDGYMRKMSGDLTIIKNNIRTLPTGGDVAAANREAQRLLDMLVNNNRDVQDAASGIRRSPALSTAEGASLIGELNSLQGLMRDVMNGLVAENTKRMIWTAGKQAAQERFHKEIKNSADAAKSLGDAMNSKLGAVVAGTVGNTVKAYWQTIFQQAIVVSYFHTASGKSSLLI
jgi:hypothetical protein